MIPAALLLLSTVQTWETDYAEGFLTMLLFSPIEIICMVKILCPRLSLEG